MPCAHLLIFLHRVWAQLLSMYIHSQQPEPALPGRESEGPGIDIFPGVTPTQRLTGVAPSRPNGGNSGVLSTLSAALPYRTEPLGT